MRGIARAARLTGCSSPSARRPPGRGTAPPAIPALEPLSGAAVAAAVADRLRRPASPALLALAASADGNPRLVAELLDGLGDERRLRVEDGRTVVLGDALPARLTEAMRARRDGLPEDARDTVRVAAVLGFASRPSSSPR